MNKYNIGQKVPREGKTSLIIFECLGNGRYLARTMRSAIRVETSERTSEPQPGQKVRLPNGKEVVLISLRKTSFWDNAHDDRIELSEQEIEVALADHNAREVYTRVATKRERGGNSASRFLPRSTETRDDD